MFASSKKFQKQQVQSEVIKILANDQNYSLSTVNRYKENIVHVCAANDCVNLLDYIVRKHGKNCLERKNAFGWTPLMQAIRNENLDTVKYLLSCGAVINDFSFLGTSVLSLASAISVEMFDLLYNNSPSALEYAALDDISPLCIAALKNDKTLFFKLIQLGRLDAHKPNEFTLIMMKQSSVPEIAALAKSTHLRSEDYWNDVADIEELLQDHDDPIDSCYTNMRSNIQDLKTEFKVPQLRIEHVPVTEGKNLKDKIKNQHKLHLQIIHENCEVKLMGLISPALSYQFELPESPNILETDNNSIDTLKIPGSFGNCFETPDTNQGQLNVGNMNGWNTESPLVLQRCQDKRPPNLKLRSSSEDSNATLSFTPQFSPSRSPNLPKHISEDDVFDETTPTPPKYRTPPRGIILDPNAKRLMVLLKNFGLKRHIPLFIEQEVDLDLFLTLTDNDLFEIGVSSKSERLILLSVITECKGREINMLL